MKTKTAHLIVTLVLGLGLTLALLWLMEGKQPKVTYAQGPDGYSTYYVAPDGDCSGMSPCFGSVQAAVDAVDDPADMVKVAAGTYTDIHQRETITQVVYISKTIIIQGGYTLDFIDPPDPIAHPTTLDAQGQGRVLLITTGVTATIEGLRITGGKIAGGGGGIYVAGSNVTLNNNTIISNTAFNDGDGGGLHLVDSTATLNGNTISANRASGEGGGLYMHGSRATLEDNTISANTAGDGGGICLWLSSVTLNGNTISTNVARDYGGGLYRHWGFAVLNGNTFFANTADTYGGGLYLDGTSDTLNGNIILSNTASAGGGLYMDSWEPWRSTLSGNSIVSNTANSGGGVYVDGNNATFSDNTVTANIANVDGGGLYIYSCHHIG